MKVFDAALQAIQTHRTYSAINSDTNTPHYVCSGCAWSDSRAGSNDEHLAAEIDLLVD
ncbi:hypothetical protein [Mycolicibacterium sphagni]|uniref:hypothetical protein n=1 Tax=Mycolicibacterium sphagni TaxID=1786 RepID=UPI0021F33BF6|nr:hypothetical protein [Mycolicibacterium sphagni]MCV7174779.1 hypothetical protein [Mycolicibacterium sphagni]